MSGSGEEIDDRIRKAREIADRCREINVIRNASFIERYVREEAYIAVRHCGIGPKKHGALLKAAIPREHWGRLIANPEISYRAWPNGCGEQSAVFPGEIQLMEGTQAIIPSRVWLQTFDDSLIDLGKPLYVFEGPGLGIVEFGHALPNREMSLPVVREIVSCGERAGENVETASNAVNDHASFGIDYRGNGFDLGEAVELFAGLRIGIDRYGIGFVLSPRDDAFFQHWQLGYGPIDSSFSV